MAGNTRGASEVGLRTLCARVETHHVLPVYKTCTPIQQPLVHLQLLACVSRVQSVD